MQLVLVTVVLLSCIQTGTTQNDGKSVFCICTATLYHQKTVLCTVEAISAALLEALLPFMNETRSGVEAIRRDLEEHKAYVNRTVSERLSNLEDNMNRIKDELGQRVEDHLVHIQIQSVLERSLNDSIRTVNENIAEYKSQTDSDLYALNMSLFGKIDMVSSRVELINVSMREEFRALQRQFQEHSNQTTSELSVLHTSLQSTIHSPPTEVMSNAVLYKLLPYINKLNASVRAMRHQIQEYKNWTFELSAMRTSISAHVNQLSEICDKMDIIGSKTDHINVSLREEYETIERHFEEHKNQTTSELSEMHTSLLSTYTDHVAQIYAKMDGINSRINNVNSAINGTIDSKLDLLDSKQSELDRKVMSINSELEQNILTNVTKQLQKTSESSHEALIPCGGEGWRRVAYLDMTDPNTTCPSGWLEMTRDSKRICDRFSTSSLTCDSVFFPVSAGAYTAVCGRIRAYQYGPTDAFESYHDGHATTIDSAYVSGASLTHGSPRQHIWTFAAGITEADPTRDDACPCDATVNISIPPFVGGDYFCESGVHSRNWGGFHPYDPLWDGQNCTSTSTCCSFNNPPYFTKQLPNPTTDDLEVRLCLLDSDEDAPIEFIELYVGLGEVNTKALHQNILSNTQKLTHMISSKMELINVSMREEFRAIERQFQEHKNQTTSELSDLHTSLQSTHTDHLTQICAKMDVIDSRLVSVSCAINDTALQEAEQNIVTNVTKETQKMSNSLHEVMEELQQNILNTVRNELYDHVHEDLGEFERDVLSNITTQLNDLAENDDLHNHVCGSTGGWTRVAYLDMTDPNTNCPSVWRLKRINSKRICDQYSRLCTSVFFPVSGGPYNRVCGRVTAYQLSNTHAFRNYHHGRATSIDEAYVDGVSLTHGSPRQHIWTFAAGISEARPTNYDSCPCDASVNLKISVPNFVGGDYFCESGANSAVPESPPGLFHPDDPLWDGKNCTNSSTCCSFNNPPYFTKRLSSPTTDDIEVRLYAIFKPYTEVQ